MDLRKIFGNQTTYKCRVEYGADIDKVKKHWKKNKIILKDEKKEYHYLDYPDGTRIRLPDTEWTFKTEATLETLIKLAKEIDDTHTLYQTLNPIELYTGERNRDI